MKDAQSFFEGGPDDNVKLRLSVNDINNAKLIGEQVENIYPKVEVVSWDEAQSSLFTALNLEKILTSIMLVMIILIGAVNIISTLVMVVSNKSSDIAILRTLGATKSMIMKIFVVQGMISGILGTLLGVFFGTVFALYAPSISQIGENIVNQFVAGGNMYFISHLRTQVNPYEVMAIGAVAILISFFATLYPAYRASKIYPAEVLRYE
jgi:ABC-type transport system, involved in lipoprotein release, permease component